jgi:DNA-binding MarR family transcriptional regulator
MAERDDSLISDMAQAGIPPQVGSAALAFDAVLQRWRRRVTKRELGQRALTELCLPIDLAQLDVMMAIWAPAHEFSCDPAEETMVSTIAARLGIDPSRASRVVADLIGLGYAIRAVSQADARRTIVELTEAGLAIVEAVRRYKFLVLGNFLSGWSEDELAAFLPLLDRFSSWTEAPDGGASPAIDRSIAQTRQEMEARLAAARGPGAVNRG